MYAYGHKRVFENISEMSMNLPVIMKWYWRICWMFITPLALMFILVMTLVKYSPTTSARRPDNDEDKYIFPQGIQALGWLMAAVAVVIIPVTGVYQAYKRRKAGKPTDIRSMFSPNEKWAPANAPKKDPVQSYDNDAFHYSKYAVETNHL